MDAMDAGKIRNTEIAAVISNNAGAYALERAKNHGIEAVCVSPKDYEDREAFNRALVDKVEQLSGGSCGAGRDFWWSFRDHDREISQTGSSISTRP